MNQRCLYCYGQLDESTIEFHPSCVREIFESNTLPSRDNLDEEFHILEDEPQDILILKALTMRLSQSTLILAAPNTLMRGEGGELLYITKRDPSAESLDELVARLDGCHFDGSVEMIAEIVESFSSIPRLDVVTLFEQVIFGWITGCSTLGLSSFSLTHPNPGVSSLAPIRDFAPTAIYDQRGDDELAIEVNGKRRGITRRDFEAALRFMDLKDRIIRITIEKMIKTQELWVTTIINSPLSQSYKESYIALISSRLATLAKK